MATEDTPVAEESDTAIRWRVGRTVGRTIYIQVGPEPDKERDILIGMMDTPGLAHFVVDAVNFCLSAAARSEEQK